MYSDYYCEKDKKITEFKKIPGKPFPEFIKCEHCGDSIPRSFSSPIISIAQGSIVHGSDYVPSDFTPLSKVHGRTTSWIGDDE